MFLFKVEFNSHYGKEHFCCTSLIRVYGTSEFEVLETENEGHGANHDLDDDDEDEQPIGVDSGKPAKNLFGHATDAVSNFIIFLWFCVILMYLLGVIMNMLFFRFILLFAKQQRFWPKAETVRIKVKPQIRKVTML